jgi:hypothetical protein
MARNVRSFLAREWPLVAAGLALASLAFLPRFIRSGARIEERDRATVAEMTRLVELEPERVEAGARAFLAARSESPHAPEARYLLGRAVVRRAEGGEFPGLKHLNDAWDALSAARAGGLDPARCWRSRASSTSGGLSTRRSIGRATSSAPRVSATRRSIWPALSPGARGSTAKRASRFPIFRISSARRPESSGSSDSSDRSRSTSGWAGLSRRSR